MPIELLSDEEGELRTGQVVEVGDQDRIGVGRHTLEAGVLAARLVGREGELWLVHAHHDFSE